MRRQQVQILIITLISIVFSLVGCKSTTSPSPANKQGGELFNAISLGLPLGVLAAKYLPDLREESGDEERRELYTQLLQDAADGLNITLDPPPDSLLSNGRGQPQYEAIESYFRQIMSQTEERSPCIKYTAGLSLNSAWLILGFHEVQNLSRSDTPLFKDYYLSKLDQFTGLSAATSVACNIEGYTEFSAKLEAVSAESLDWEDRVRSSSNDQVAAEVISIGSSLADRLVELAEIASGLPTP